jgi:uncharacterized protein YdeI (YjbR/CyaY-like superfamily)
MGSEFPLVDPGSRSRWRAWLANNHTRSHGVWLAVYKKKNGQGALSYEEAVEEALCFGWIDGRTNAMDEARYKLRMTPRQPGSGWSRLNKRRVEKLTRLGLMSPAGQARVDVAMRDGSWEKLDPIENLEVPPDLERALGEVASARSNFKAFSPGYRKQLLYWIGSAKRPETRSRRIAETVKLSAANDRQYFSGNHTVGLQAA